MIQDINKMKSDIVNSKFLQSAAGTMGILFLILSLAFYNPEHIEIFIINIISTATCFLFFVLCFRFQLPRLMVSNVLILIIFFNSIGIFYSYPDTAHAQLYWIAISMFLAFLINHKYNAFFWLIVCLTFITFVRLQAKYNFHFTENEYQLTSDDFIDCAMFSISVFVCLYFIDKVQNAAMVRLSSANTELQKTKRDLINSQKYKDDFFAKVSHELRTPLIAIKGIADILKKNPADENAPSYYSSLQYSAEHLLSVVNEILDLSKINDGNFELKKDVVNIKKVIEDTYQSLANIAVEKKLEMSLDLDPALPPYILIDKKRFTQVLYNLIQNGLKFTEKGYVKISARMQGSELMLTIVDSGIGISKEFINTIFDNFTQENRIENTEFFGTGLGLNISYRIAKLMQGDLSCESEKNVGSTFMFRIPLQNAETPALEADVSVSDMDFEKKPLRCILADDNEMNLMVIEKILGDHFKNWTIDLAKNGKDVLVLLGKQDYDLLLLDLQMPIMDGYETADAIRLLEYKIVTVAMTASISDDIVKKCKHKGIYDVIVKPFDIPMLTEILKNVFQNKSIK